MKAVAHLNDATIVRLLDLELDAEPGAAAVKHLDACTVCRARVHALRTVSGHVATVPVGASSKGEARPSSTWFARAAIVMLMIGAGLGVQPVRAWIGGWLTDDPAPSPPLDLPNRAQEPQSLSSLMFRPDTAPFTVRMRSSQAGGVIRVRFVESQTARVSVDPEDMPPDILIRRTGLEISNAGESAASIELWVPAYVPRVHIAVGSNTPVELRPYRSTAEVIVVPLSANRR